MNAIVRRSWVSVLLRRTSFLLLFCITLYMIQYFQRNLPRIQIVSFYEINAARDAGASRLARGPGKYERWEHLHDKIESVLREYGSVSSETDPLPDFYVSGDWFHENTDGFSICSSKPLSKELLLRLQEVLSGHHRHA
ncbi:MAG: hypothetical protein ACK50J_31130, partial [Planctomyces sp.]